jgi:hypothetical protein
MARTVNSGRRDLKTSRYQQQNSKSIEAPKTKREWNWSAISAIIAAIAVIFSIYQYDRSVKITTDALDDNDKQFIALNQPTLDAKVAIEDNYSKAGQRFKAFYKFTNMGKMPMQIDSIVSFTMDTEFREGELSYVPAVNTLVPANGRFNLLIPIPYQFNKKTAYIAVKVYPSVANLRHKFKPLNFYHVWKGLDRSGNYELTMKNAAFEWKQIDSFISTPVAEKLFVRKGILLTPDEYRSNSVIEDIMSDKNN